jgi:hypothetical protein
MEWPATFTVAEEVGAGTGHVEGVEVEYLVLWKKDKLCTWVSCSL